MTKEKFKAQVEHRDTGTLNSPPRSFRHYKVAPKSPPSPLERIKAMCEGLEFDCQEAEMRSRDKPELASYYRGRATAFSSILSLIRELERGY